MHNRLTGKTALITGATSGIGLESARQLAELGVNLILTGRRSDRLEQIKTDFTGIYGVEIDTYAFDVAKLQACEAFHGQIADRTIDILINNAGLASGLDRVQDADIADWEAMIDTNIKGLIYITRLFLPAMISRNSGHIINVSSIAGHESYPGGSVYCASKHAVHAFTRSLKMDIGHTAIRVGMVSPGAVETEFSLIRFKGQKEKADAVYAGMTPLTATDIAEIIVFMLNRPAHVNIMDSLVMPVAQSAATMVHRDAES
ncbi:MAG: Short-chain alcohol dehydrogenase of unknown specificity [Bacteroidetes bacterium HLUCCA01]|nr:MAG: Short-chain alcohol dehydrogenase of unknown specificity [Bacteroidetes bacterium HLUCCA01]